MGLNLKNYFLIKMEMIKLNVSLKKFKDMENGEYNFLIRENSTIIPNSNGDMIVVNAMGHPLDLKLRQEKWDELVDIINYLRNEVKKIPGTKRFSKVLEKIISLLGKIQDERLSYNQKNELIPLFYYQNIKMYDLLDNDKLKPIDSEICEFIFLYMFFLSSFYEAVEEFESNLDKIIAQMKEGDYNG